MEEETRNDHYLQSWVKREQQTPPYGLLKREVRTQLDSCSCQNRGELQPQRRGRSVVEGSLEINEMVLLLGASSSLCCRDFMGLLQFWETKGR